MRRENRKPTQKTEKKSFATVERRKIYCFQEAGYKKRDENEWLWLDKKGTRFPRAMEIKDFNSIYFL